MEEGLQALFLQNEVNTLVQLSDKNCGEHLAVQVHSDPNCGSSPMPSSASETHQPGTMDALSLEHFVPVTSDKSPPCETNENVDLTEGDVIEYYSDSSYCSTYSENPFEDASTTNDPQAGEAFELCHISNEFNMNSESGNQLITDSTSELVNSSEKSLVNELGIWTIKHNVCPSVLDSLLKILIRHNNPNLPRCSKTVLKTPRSTRGLIKDLGGGQYAYLGFESGLLSRLSSHLVEKLKDNNCIQSDIFVDGITPYKSAKLHLWVIAGCIVGMNTPFVIALWCGKIHEPNSTEDFFEDFVQETIKLKEQGLMFKGTTFQIQTRNYIADAPARAWVKGVVPHNSYHSFVRGETPLFPCSYLCCCLLMFTLITLFSFTSLIIFLFQVYLRGRMAWQNHI